MGQADIRPLRIACVRWVLFAAFGLAVLSQANKHILAAPGVLAKARSLERLDVVRVDPASKGTIVTADGRTVARSFEAWEMSLNYDAIPHTPGFFRGLSAASGIPESELAEPRLGGKKRVFWKQPLNLKQCQAVRTWAAKWLANGVSLDRVPGRDYSMGTAMSGIVGAVRDGEPIAGLELSARGLLAGERGEYVGIYDRNSMFVRSETRQPKRDGLVIGLTIDSQLQAEASDAIRRAVEANQADSGSAIILDPSNGDILAMANWPSFDPNGRIPGFAGKNSAFTSAFEPGSTFKILAALKAYDMGVIDDSFHYYCSGGIEISRGRVAKCTHVHHQVGLERAIAVSCNGAAVQWAWKIGHENMLRYFDQLELIEGPGLGLPFEAKGRYSRNETAKRLQLATFGFGQSLSATPVALAGAFSTIANGGELMRPRIVARLGGRPIPPQSMGQIVKPESAGHILSLMESVIQSDSGTGHSLRIPGYRLAGKTGTAEKVGAPSVHGHKAYVSNFVGFVPANEPKATVLVMIDNPKAGRYYGAEVAGPVFEDLARAVLRRYGIRPELPSLSSPRDAE